MLRPEFDEIACFNADEAEGVVVESPDVASIGLFLHNDPHSFSSDVGALPIGKRENEFDDIADPQVFSSIPAGNMEGFESFVMKPLPTLQVKVGSCGHLRFETTHASSMTYEFDASPALGRGSFRLQTLTEAKGQGATT